MFIKICLAIIVGCQIYNVYRGMKIDGIVFKMRKDLEPILRKAKQGLSAFVPDEETHIKN